ncbi:MAG: non-ribosomal peptide synthetase, partial [Acidobacteriota bacterium]
DPGATVPALFVEAARRWPGAVAVDFGGETLTYAELDARSNRLARRLAALGVGPETVVGLGLDRSPDLVAGLLGIWKAGGAFVPMDPGYPDLRLKFLAEDSGAAVVVTRERWRERLGGFAPVVCLEEEGVEAETRAARPGDLAYLIYTSGTTGTPKAVLVEHRSLANTLGSAQRRFGFRLGDRMPCLASFSFDIFLFELLNPLLAGGTSVLFGLDPTLDVERVAASLRDMTHLHAVPAVMKRIVESARSASVEAPSLREIFVGGDLVPPDLLAELREVFPGARTHVLYGPTEATIICTSHPAAAGEDRPWIGRPLPNARVLLVGRGGLLAPVGAVGEIWIGGAGVARGYRNREELTAERFAERDGERFYRTGDLGRWSATGVLEFLGRLDDQVKVRGFRIEPGEIEAALRQSPQVQDAAVAVWGEGEDRRLAAYFVPAEGSDIPTPDELRDFLRRSLPEHMIPAAFLELPAIPLTPHGKVDRRHLPEPEGFGQAEYVAPKEGTEEILAAIWAELLDAPRVGARDNFFDLGGHSLLATRLASRVRETFGVELPLRAIFEHPTLAELAGAVEELVLADIDALSEDEARALLES